MAELMDIELVVCTTKKCRKKGVKETLASGRGRSNTGGECHEGNVKEGDVAYLVGCVVGCLVG